MQRSIAASGTFEIVIQTSHFACVKLFGKCIQIEELTKGNMFWRVSALDFEHGF